MFTSYRSMLSYFSLHSHPGFVGLPQAFGATEAGLSSEAGSIEFAEENRPGDGA